MGEGGAALRQSIGGFECGARDPGLANDAVQCAASELVVKGNGNGRAANVGSLLHHGVASALSDALESMLFKNAANGVAR
jgi:hypothetical protein